MAWARAGIVLGVVIVGLVALSGGHDDDPRTPAGQPGLPAPLFGMAVIGDGGRTAAVDAYGDVVDLRAPGPVGQPLVAVSSKRQAAGTVPVSSAIVARARLADGRTPPFWRANSVRQHYVPGTNVLRTVAWFGDERKVVVRRTGGPGEVGADRRWLGRAHLLNAAAPRWAKAMYRRSLLVLRALTDRRSGAVAAGARDGWAYVWPRDAATVAMAFASAGYGAEARRVARFLTGLGLDTAARFRGSGAPVSGRAAQGDAAGWVAAAVGATGLEAPRIPPPGAPNMPGDRWQWGDRADYQEGEAGDYLGNAIAAGADLAPFEAGPRLVRIAGDASSGLDSAAAWAVRPFPQPALYPAVRRTLLRLVAARGSRFGIVPSQNWRGGNDPWTAPTAWTAWALATLARHDRGRRAHRDRRAALGLLADLRRAATPLGLLPERVDADTGLPTSTTPLAWSHAFAILALRTLWPGRAGG
ncbi:MAG TPA: glycoside hydrolase family 15 protein [Solirubrobacterales bacterium]|nr:glycoside hydrolase family 15 protein [Solirubrobacterales bacterium]